MKITESTTIEEINEFLKDYTSRGEVELSCSYCGKKFTATKHNIQGRLSRRQQRGTNLLLYCSNSCSTKRYNRIRGYGTVDIECACCGKQVVRGRTQHNKNKNSFCDSVCAAKYNNRKHPKRKATTPEPCPTCGNPKSSVAVKCVDCFNRERAARSAESLADRLEAGRRAVGSYKKRMKLKAIEYKGGSCSLCGYNKSIRSLEFHHVNPSEKDFSLSSVTRKWEVVKPELDKCILVCANCHGEIHEGLHPDLLVI